MWALEMTGYQSLSDFDSKTASTASVIYTFSSWKISGFWTQLSVLTKALNICVSEAVLDPPDQSFTSWTQITDVNGHHIE